MTDHTPDADLQRIIESAQRLGIELDPEEALQWLAAMAAFQGSEDITTDTKSGIFGHRVVMLDFSPQQLDYFRQVGKIVEFHEQPGVVETALALSGSSAQSKIQTYPGDCDYFERVNIKAPTRQQACGILADLIRQKALDTLKGPTYQLIEIKFGQYPEDLLRNERLMRKDSPVAWGAEDVRLGQFQAARPDGTPVTITWDSLAEEPAWCKLDWVIADPVHGRLANASNMLDVTWEAPDGSITPLDGYLDPYFQEVYLETESIPIFSKLAQHVSADALDHYVEQLEHEVNKYLTRDVNYGKAAKRMYNIFRLTGRYEEAAFLRELFDEPTTMLYQVWSLIRTIDDASKPGTAITAEQMLAQADQLILAVIQALEGDEEVEIVRQLLQLRSALSTYTVGQTLSGPAETARLRVINIVNNFFYEKLTGYPAIKAYIEGLAQAE